jgi:hypothetical protein
LVIPSLKSTEVLAVLALNLNYPFFQITFKKKLSTMLASILLLFFVFHFIYFVTFLFSLENKFPFSSISRQLEEKIKEF